MSLHVRPRILLVGPELVLEWTESVARALTSVGCSVETVFYNRLSRAARGVGGRRTPVISRMRRRLTGIPPVLREGYARWRAAWAGRAMLDAARRFKPDLILMLKGESLRASILERLKAATGATLAGWWVDHPFMNAETKRPWSEVPACLPLYDACFVFDRSYEGGLSRAGARAVHFLPCAADPTLYRPFPLTVQERASYGASVSLIGVYTESRAAVLSGLCSVPGLGIWGPGWQGWLAERRAREAFRGEGLSPHEACRVYNASMINLNTHHHQSRDGGVNTRAFEIPAAGGFELTDHVPGMEALLEPGREVAVYRTAEEAADLARYYAKAEDERRRIAEAGRRRVLAEHTYRHRMETLLRVAGR